MKKTSPPIPHLLSARKKREREEKGVFTIPTLRKYETASTIRPSTPSWPLSV
jgi:hypothetical protein